jgi:pyruvate formate lyase activating enzyme
MMTPQTAMEHISRNMPFIRGITVSGGECSLYRDFVLELFRLAKEQGLSTLMDSNGSYDFSSDPELLRFCDGVMLDIKCFDEARHISLTGQSNRQVLDNAVFLAGYRKLPEVRTVIVRLPPE